MGYQDPGAAEVIKRTTIRMPYLSDAQLAKANRLGGSIVVDPSSPIALRRAAAQMAVQFRRETAYDFAPYDAREPNGVVVLIPARRFLIAYGRLIAGAIGIDPTVFYQGLPQPVPRATWVYLHPYERGRAAVIDVWPALAQRWPGLSLAGPFTPAGRVLVDRLIEQSQHPTHLGETPIHDIMT